MVAHKHIELSLKLFRLVMQKNKIPFWLEYGTQLGAVRDGKLIPWDKDGDVGVMLSSIQAMKDAQKDFKRVGLRVDYQPGHAFVNLKISDREWIATLDVYTFAIKERQDKKWVVRMERGKVFDIRAPFEYYESMKAIYFLGAVFLVPGKAEEALEFAYGKQWKTPIEIKPEVYTLKNPTPQELNKHGRTGRKKWKDVLD